MHKSVALQQRRQQLAAVEKARADSAEAMVLQLQQQLSSATAELSAAESALRSDATFRSAIVKHFPDLASVAAVISKIREMQQTQLQLEDELFAARKQSSSAAAALASAELQLLSATAHQQQLLLQQQALQQQLHKAEAAAAATAASACARQSVLNIFDFEKFVEVMKFFYARIAGCRVTLLD
jgi:hypothetical protein